MADEKKKDEGYSFIHEKIKDKPLSKKRVAKEAIVAVCLGILFGAAACLTNEVLKPAFEKDTETEEVRENFDLPQDTLPEVDENENLDVDTEEPVDEPDVVIETKELETSDYQKLYDEIYAIGTEANRYIVNVTGVSSDTDVFETTYEKEGTAAGVIIGDDGVDLLVLTRKEVLTGAEKIKVSFIDESVIEAEIIGMDEGTGLAVIGVPLSEISEETNDKIKVATLSNSYLVKQGQVVLALGSPLGSVYSILIGSITSSENEVSVADGMYNVFMTDMVGNTGGSGVLINLDGEVIGIMLPDMVKDEDTDIINAVSISELKALIEKMSNGESMPYLGVYMNTITSDIAKLYDLPEGAYVKSVEMNSPAYEAGLRVGDIIVKIGVDGIKTAREVETYLRNSDVGDAISIKVKRLGNGEYKDVTCTATLTMLQ